jgi:hypothetical protein
MTSAAKIRANRRNALRSTGPKTAAGKVQSQRNAFKHGLALDLDHDESRRQEVDLLALELARLSAEPREQLRLIAKLQIALERIQQTQAKIIERHMTSVFEEIDDSLTDEARIARARIRALPELMRLERYQRRGLSALRRMLRHL